MAKEFSKEIIASFLDCKKSGWSEKSYAKFVEQAKKYLKGQINDPLERSKLVVEISKFISENKLDADKK